jgi:hypothetical protein
MPKTNPLAAFGPLSLWHCPLLLFCLGVAKSKMPCVLPAHAAAALSAVVDPLAEMCARSSEALNPKAASRCARAFQSASHWAGGAGGGASPSAAPMPPASVFSVYRFRVPSSVCHHPLPRILLFCLSAPGSAPTAPAVLCLRFCVFTRRCRSAVHFRSGPRIQRPAIPCHPFPPCYCP